MKLRTACSLFTILLIGFACKKDDSSNLANNAPSRFTTKITFFRAQSQEAVSGLKVHYARITDPFTEDGYSYTQSDGSISLFDNYSNSFSTTPYKLELPSLILPERPSPFNPPVVLRNQGDQMTNYLFDYFPVSQTDRVREYKVDVYSWATLKIQLKQENLYKAQHSDGELSMGLFVSYRNQSGTLKADQEDIFGSFSLRRDATLDTTVYLTIFAGLDCEIKWTVFESYTPTVIPANVDPSWYYETDRVKSGSISQSQLQTSETKMVALNF